MIAVISMFWALNKTDMKLRMYEDDEETAILDLNNAINRKMKKTAVLNLLSHEE